MSIRRLVQNGLEATRPDRTEVWCLDSEEAAKAFDALSSDTARKTLAALYEKPQTTSSLSKSLDLSIQNTNYHIQNFREAGLVEIAGTEYSDQGNEMNVYAPSKNAALLLSNQSFASRIRTRLPEILAVGAVLGVMTLIFRVLLVERFIDSPAEESLGDETITLLSGNLTVSGEEETYFGQLTGITTLEEVPLWLDPAVTFGAGALVGIGLVLVIQYGLQYR